MARNEYSPSVAASVCEIIAETGTIAAASKVLKIPDSTIHRWKDIHPEFKEAIARARDTFTLQRDPELIAVAKEKYINYLVNGATEEWSGKDVVTNPDGSQTLKQWDKKVKRDSPKWAIEWMLGKPEVHKDKPQAVALMKVATEILRLDDDTPISTAKDMITATLEALILEIGGLNNVGKP